MVGKHTADNVNEQVKGGMLCLHMAASFPRRPAAFVWIEPLVLIVETQQLLALTVQNAIKC